MTVIFFIFAALAVLGAPGVVIAKNPLHSALSLIGTMVSIVVEDSHSSSQKLLFFFPVAFILLPHSGQTNLSL